MSDLDNPDEKGPISELDTPEFRHGYEVGHSFGLYASSSEAIAAYEQGEIDLWIEYQRPKTFEEWEAFEKKHGNLSNRWVTSSDNNE